MSVPSHFHMPSPFHGEGVHPGLFRPPMPSPSTSSYSSCRPQMRPTPSFGKRKRNEISRSQVGPFDGEYEGEGYFGTPTGAQSSDDRRYYLAGQLDTPCSAAMDTGMLGESMYSDSNYRRELGSKRDRDDMMDITTTGSTPLFALPPQPVQYQGWGSFAFNTIGSVVGRVWEFCKTAPFRGFQAGGGKAFEVTDQGLQQISQARQEENAISDAAAAAAAAADHNAGDPDYQDGGEGADSRPRAKRRHTEQPDELGRNWVMVDSSEKKTFPFQPQRRIRPVPKSRFHGPSVASSRRMSQPVARVSSVPISQPRRSSIRAPSTPVSFETPRPASSASFASPRSSTPTPSRIPAPVSSSQPQHQRRTSSLAPSLAPSPAPARSHRRSQSNASVASNRGGGANNEPSPRLDAEAQHLAAQWRIEERNADVRISAFNKQLQDMIRQGKEALGTTIEIDGSWEDEL